MKHHTNARQEDAVSPVIAVILMVAITVVLAATVWIWISGFGAPTNGPPPTLGLSQGASMTTNATQAAAQCTAGAAWCLKWTVTSVSAGFPPTRLRLVDQTNNVTLNLLVNGAAPTSAELRAGDSLAAYSTSTPPTAGDLIGFADTQTNTLLTSLVAR